MRIHNYRFAFILLFAIALCDTTNLGLSAAEPSAMTAVVSRAGELAERLGENAREVTKLTVEGPLNESDLAALYEASYMGSLEELDLSSTRVEGDALPDYAFYRYNLGRDSQTLTIRLKKIALPSGLRSIGKWAFYNAYYLEEVELPATLTEIGEAAFYGCPALKKISFPAALTSVGESAFEGSGIEKAVFANGLQSVGKRAFAMCASLTEAFLPNSVASVGSEAFTYCTALKSLVIPAGLQTIPTRLAMCDYSLQTLTIPDGVAGIQLESLTLCIGLRWLNIPEGVGWIEERALTGLPRLTTLMLPSTLNRIYEESLGGLPSLKTIYCKAAEPPTFVASELYDGAGDASAFEMSKPANAWLSTPANVKVYVPAGCAAKYKASPSWSRFSDIVETDQFPTYDELMAAQPKPIATTIETGIAGRLASLMAGIGTPIGSLSVRGPLNDADFEAMWHAAFFGDLAKVDLTEATIADGVLPAAAFYNRRFARMGTTHIPVGLREIALPSTIKQIGDSAFYGASCLESVTLPPSITRIGNAAFQGCQAVRNGLEELPASLREIGRGAFSGCKGLTAGSLPPSVESIGELAFYDTSIRSANLTERVSALGAGAFAECVKLNAATLPESLKTLPESLFSGCLSLETLTIPSGVTEIPKNFLFSAQSLKSVTIPDGVTQFGANALNRCRSLTSLALPSKCTYYQLHALEGCLNLRELVLPASVWQLGPQSLAGLASLEKLYCKNPTPAICLTQGLNGAFGTISCGEGIDINTPKEIPVYVPTGSVQTYQNANGWTYFANFIATDNFPEAGIEAVAEPESAVVVRAEGGRIVMEGSAAALNYAVYTTDGRLAATGRISNGAAAVSAAPGLYIVKCGSTTAKVAVP